MRNIYIHENENQFIYTQPKLSYNIEQSLVTQNAKNVLYIHNVNTQKYMHKKKYIYIWNRTTGLNCNKENTTFILFPLEKFNLYTKVVYTHTQPYTYTILVPKHIPLVYTRAHTYIRYHRYHWPDGIRFTKYRQIYNVRMDGKNQFINRT